MNEGLPPDTANPLAGTPPPAGMQEALGSVGPAASLAGAPPPEGMQEAVDQEKYQEPLQKLKAFGEEAVRTLPIVGRVGLKAIGADPEESAKREKYSLGIPGKFAANALGLGLQSLLAPEIGLPKALGLAGSGAAKALGFAAKESGYLAKVGKAATTMAAENALFQANDEAAKLFNGDPEQTIGSAAANIGEAGSFGAALGGLGAGVVSPLWKVTAGPKVEAALKSLKAGSEPPAEAAEPGIQIRPILKKAISVIGGVPEATVDDYLANHEAAKSVPGFQEIYDHALDHVNHLNDQVSNHKMDVDAAKDSFNEYSRDIKENLRQQGFEASMADRLSKQALKDAQNNLALDLQDKALKSSPQVVENMERLRSDVVVGSSDAFDVLSQSEKTVPLKSFYENAQKLQDELKSRATIESRQMADRLGQYEQGVKETYGDSVRGPAAKLIIQGLDSVSKYDYNASSFDKGLSNYYKRLRFHLDDTLKDTIPDYRKAMEPVAKDTKLLRSLENYGTEEDAVNRIKGLKNPARYQNEMPLLNELANRYGGKFTETIDSYASPERRAKLIKAMPEYAEAQKNAATIQELKSPETRAALEEHLNTSPEAQRLSAAQEQLGVSQAAKEEIKGITPQSIQGKLNSAKAGKSIEGIKALSKIPGIEGKSIPDLLDLIRINEAFEKDATRGSRHVNMYGAVIGALAGLATGHVAGAIEGGGAGAMIGGFMDKYGPKVVKQALDSYIDKFGSLVKDTGGSPGAVKMATYWALSGDMPVNAESFKAMVDLAESTIKGTNLIKNASRAIIKNSGDAIKSNLIPDEKSRKRLDKRLQDLHSNAGDLLNRNDQIGYYMPDHGAAMAAMAARSVDYLNGLRPKTNKAGLLDSEPVASVADQAKYNKALDIAQQPLLIAKLIKDGTLTPEDVATVKIINPGFYSAMANKLNMELIDHTAKGDRIPYSTRLSLSLFLGQALDSTMTPQGILAAQSTLTGKSNQQEGAEAMKQQSKVPQNALSKLAASNQTPQQARVSEKNANVS